MCICVCVCGDSAADGDFNVIMQDLACKRDLTRSRIR